MVIIQDLKLLTRTCCVVQRLCDKIDYGAILLSVKDDDLVSFGKYILSSNIFERPTIKMSIYKNRRGRYKGVIFMV